MGEWIVVFLRVHEFGYRLVGHELRRGKGHGHAEGGRVGDVKGLQAFCSVEGFGALGEALVHRAMDLHALFDDCLN